MIATAETKQTAKTTKVAPKSTNILTGDLGAVMSNFFQRK